MTGNWPCYRFLHIEAWNACRIFYSLGLARLLQVSKKIFWDILSKIRFHNFVGLDLEYRLSTHNMVISLELKATKNQKWKKLKIPPWVPFWNDRLHLLTKNLEKCLSCPKVAPPQISCQYHCWIQKNSILKVWWLERSFWNNYVRIFLGQIQHSQC